MNNTVRAVTRNTFRLIVVLGVCLGIVLFMMSTLAGNGEQLRKGAEDFLSQATSTRAVIGDLEYLGFIPDIRLHVKEITFQKNGDPTDIQMSMGEMELSMPIWNYFGRKKMLETLRIENFMSVPGHLTPQRLSIESLDINDDAAASPALVLAGAYGSESLSMTLGLDKEIFKNGRALFSYKDSSPLSLKVGEIEMDGVLVLGGGVLRIRDMTLTAPALSLHLDIAFSAEKGALHAKGKIFQGQEEGVFNLTAQESGRFHVLVTGTHSPFSESMVASLKKLSWHLDGIVGEKGGIHLDFSGVSPDNDMKTESQ